VGTVRYNEPGAGADTAYGYVLLSDEVSERDLTDVRGIVRAYWLFLDHCEPGDVYVIASGRSYAIREVLSMYLEMARCRIEIEVDPERLRPSDVPVLEGNWGLRLVGDRSMVNL